MMDGRARYRATFKLLAAVASLGILLATPLASLTALAAPGGTLASDHASAPLGALGNPSAPSSEAASGIGPGRLVGAASVDAVLDQATVDLAMTKTGPATATVGTNFTYTLTVANAGPAAATNTTVTDLLLAGLTFVSATASQGACSLSGQLVTCQVGTVAAAGGATVTITVQPQASLAGFQITNTASVSSTETDTNPGNNTGAASTSIQAVGTPTATPPPTTPADMALTKTAPTSATVGTNFTYTLTTTNAGPGTATNVTVTDLLLTGLTFVSATASQGACSTSGQLVTCTLGTMAVGATATNTIVVQPQATLAGATVTNNATVSAAQPDTNPNNNSGSATTLIVGTGTPVPTNVPTSPADMSLTKVASPNPVSVGANLTYSYTITNNGPGVATGVTMSDFVQSGLTFVSATASQGTCALANTTLTCTVGTMNPGATVTVTNVVQPQATLAGSTITNTASVASQQPDPNPANNSASASVTISGTSTPISATQTAIAATLTATGGGPVVPPGVNPPSSTGQTGVPCTTRIGGTCTATGAVTGTFTKLAAAPGMTFNITATGPANTAPRGVPAIFIPTTVGVESFGCTPVGVAAPFTTICTGTTRGDLLLNATVTVRFPLVGGGTQDVVGTVTGQGAPPLNVQQAIAQVQPSGLAGLPCGDTVGQTCQATGAVQGLGAVTGSMTWTLTATIPAGVVAGTVPVAVFSTTVGLEGFPCTATVAGATTVTCAVTTVGNALLGSNITVVFAPGLVAIGTVQGPGPIALQALASAPPPLLPPPLPPLPPPPPFGAPPLLPPPPQPPSMLAVQPTGYPGVPVIPEADSLFLLLGGLAALGVLAARRASTRRP